MKEQWLKYPAIVFGEVWRNRIRGQLVSMEEGIYDHWYIGRTPLVGDSAHKVYHERVSYWL
jgi:hypothetical protein